MHASQVYMYVNNISQIIAYMRVLHYIGIYTYKLLKICRIRAEAL